MSPKAEKHRVDARKPPSRQRLAEDPRPISVAELANEIDTDARRRETWREGSKETLHSRFFALHVSMSLLIELDSQVLKQELGLNQFMGRNWRGLNHHASLCIAVYGFLVSEPLKHPLQKESRAHVKSNPNTKTHGTFNQY